MFHSSPKWKAAGLTGLSWSLWRPWSSRTTQNHKKQFISTTVGAPAAGSLFGEKRPGTDRRLQSVSGQQGEGGHDAEAQQDEEHFEQLLPGWVELVGEDLQEGDVDKGSRRQSLQDGLDQGSGGELRLHHADADGDADGRHHGEHPDVRRQPQRRNAALHQLHGQAEHDDALVDNYGDADLQHLDKMRRFPWRTWR